MRKIISIIVIILSINWIARYYLIKSTGLGPEDVEGVYQGFEDFLLFVIYLIGGFIGLLIGVLIWPWGKKPS